MSRKLAIGLLAVVLLTGRLAAAEVKGTIAKIDADKGVLTVQVDSQTKEFKVAADCACQCPLGMALKEGLKSKLFRKGAPVIVSYEVVDGKEVVTKVKSGYVLKK